MAWSYAEVAFAIAAIALALRYREKVKKRNLGRVVLIGASSGIGKELALQMVEREAYQLILVARSKEKLIETVEECNRKTHSQKCTYFEADISKPAQIQALLEVTAERMGGLETLIICSGVLSTVEFAKMDDTEKITNQIFQTNAIGPILCTKLFLPLLEAQRSSQIVVISSAAGVIPAPTRTLYTASKHALTGFFRALRIEVRKKGISICHVMPGSVDTPLRDSALDAKQVQVAKESMEIRDSPIRAPPTPNNNERKAMSPAKCAKLILDASENGVEELYIPQIYQLGVLVGVLFPGLLEYLAIRKYKFK